MCWRTADDCGFCVRLADEHPNLREANMGYKLRRNLLSSAILRQTANVKWK